MTRGTSLLTFTDPVRAAQVLKHGGVVAFPTETVYGLGADATNDGAVREVFRLKGRPADHPVIVHLPSEAELARWAKTIPEVTWRLTEAFWPGPLTLVLERQPWVSNGLTGGQETVGVRVPAHPLAQALLRHFGGGVAAPSANRFGRISPTTAEHVWAEFGNAVQILDGGAAQVGLESTILDLSREVPQILRPGAVSAAMLESVLQRPVQVSTRKAVLRPGRSELAGETSRGAAAVPRVSGSLKSHYAPQTPALLVEDASLSCRAGDAVLSRKTQDSRAKTWHTLPNDPGGYGRLLYAALRALDACGAARILIEAVPDSPAWAAVRDRLARATASAEPNETTKVEETRG